MLCFHNIEFDICYFCVTIIYRGGIFMNELLGNRIKMLRVSKNFTQEQIAERLGISRQKFSRIENGSNSITLDILSKVAEILDVSVSDITRVLDEKPAVAYRAADAHTTSQEIFDMLDLFYANKHLFSRLQSKTAE